MNMCRTCLKTPAEKHISDLEKSADEDKTCLDIMLFCLDITVAQDSKITTNLCNNCYRKIISFYKFKTLSLKNDAYLKSLDPFVQLVDVKLLRNMDKDGIKHENILDFDEFGPSLVEDLHTEIKVEMDYQNEDTLDNVESDEEPLSEVRKVKYEYIEEEIKENAPIQKKPMPRKNKCGQRKGENAPKNKTCGPSKNENAPRKKKRVSKKGKLENSKEERHICEKCGECYVNLKEHSVRHQPKEQRQMLQCKACPKQFFSIGGRNKHYRISHLGKKSKCDICNKKVACLSVHKKFHNRDAMQYGCMLCDRRYVSQSALDFHMTRHTKLRPFECDACRMKFRCKSRLSRHIRSVHEKEKKYQCHICPKAFFQKMRLQTHIRSNEIRRSHTNERPYKCEECGKAFGAQTTLKNHQLTHSGEKNISCTLCDMTFLRPGYLRVHMISHTKEKRHACQYCGARFGRSDHRRRHELTAHQKHFTKK